VSFSLDPCLSKDAFAVGDMTISRVLLMNDARWPWLILVPRREGLVELTDLDAPDRARLMEEAAAAASFLKRHANADKMNIATLGNIVRQLHLHVVARFVGDTAWPGPVWGCGGPRPYREAEARALIERVRKELGLAPLPTA
jgi:diadenosine tetraphosphate (Ap4A) HIT family hydrolase